MISVYLYQLSAYHGLCSLGYRADISALCCLFELLPCSLDDGMVLEHIYRSSAEGLACRKQSLMAYGAVAQDTFCQLCPGELAAKQVT